MRIVFIGAPGAGKGTQSVRLAQSLGIPHLSTGDMLRDAKAAGTDVGRLAAAYLDSGRLVPDDVVVSVVGEHIDKDDCTSDFLLDGFPRTVAQAEALDAILDDLGMPLDAVLNFVVGQDELVSRLASRGRGDDEPETIRRRFEEFESSTRPVLEYYGGRGLLHDIDGVGTTDEVYRRIEHALGIHS